MKLAMVVGGVSLECFKLLLNLEDSTKKWKPTCDSLFSDYSKCLTWLIVILIVICKTYLPRNFDVVANIG